MPVIQLRYVLALAGAIAAVTVVVYSQAPRPVAPPAPQQATAPPVPSQAPQLSPGSSTPTTPSNEPNRPALNPSDVSLLPLPPAELKKAGNLARHFVQRYLTYRFDTDPDAYRSGLRALAAPPLLDLLDQASSGSAAHGELVRNRVIANGRATLVTIRMLASTSVVYLVAGHQTITSTAGTQVNRTTYAVTVVVTEDGWKVSDIQPASAGDHGDTSP